jgi:hypothetical protein
MMMALVGPLEVVKYNDDGDDNNLVHVDFICCRHISINSCIM